MHSIHPWIYDVIVVGAGHAGCEAAHAAARMGCRTLLLTIDLDKLAHMSCNPSIGGPAKGHLVREIDALGGLMGRVTDRTFIQIRLLNESKGPAVQAPRAQADKRLYARVMKETLETIPNLDLRQAMIERIILPRPVNRNGSDADDGGSALPRSLCGRDPYPADLPVPGAGADNRYVSTRQGDHRRCHLGRRAGGRSACHCAWRRPRCAWLSAGATQKPARRRASMRAQSIFRSQACSTAVQPRCSSAFTIAP
jgi:hypothetical protein